MIRRLAGVCTALILATCGGGTKAQTAATLPAVTSESTPGGIAYQRALLPEAERQSVQVYWRDAGLKTDPGRFWLYMLATRVISGGPAGASRSDFTESLKDMQAGFNLNVIADAVHLGFNARPDRMAEAAESVGAMLHDPALRRGRLDERRTEAVRALEQERLNGEALAGKVWLRRIVAPASVHPALSRDPDLIKAGDTEAIRAWMQAVLTRKNMVVATAGPLDAATVGPIIDRLLGKLPAEGKGGEKPVALIQNDGRAPVTVEAQVAQTVLIGGGPASYDEEADEAALSIANATLAGGFSSRLYRKLREEGGATYGVRAFTERMNDRQFIFGIRTAVDHDRSVAALKGLTEEYARWHRDGITEEEFRDTRTKMMTLRVDELRRPPALAGYLARAMLRGERTDALGALRRKYGTLTRDDVNAFIRRAYPQHLSLVVVTPRPGAFEAECRIRTVEEVAGCK